MQDLKPALILIERRNVAGREALQRRILAEFDEMPGLCVTLEQAAKLFGLTSAISSRILQSLMDERVLRQTADERYVLMARAGRSAGV